MIAKERQQCLRWISIVLFRALMAYGSTGCGVVMADQRLPVFLSDNHAETFGWIARTFDLDEPHVLVLLDAHSDASAAERSEEMRDGLRRVTSEHERNVRVETWRQQGRLQAYNWIEPLMPRPVDQVCWLAADEMGEDVRKARQSEAVESLDGRLEVEPRSAGSFADRWFMMDRGGLQRWKPGQKPVILAVDLDFFAGMNGEQRERAMEGIWSQAMTWPGLRGVAFAVSRPWLRDDAEADALVSMACDCVSRTRGAVMQMDVSVDDRPDDSLRGKEIGEDRIPRWDAAKASLGLRARWNLMGGQLRMMDGKREIRRIFDGGDALPGEIRPDDGHVDCDGVWRFPAGQAPVLRVHVAGSVSGRVRWHALEPAMGAFDLLPETGLGKGFAQAPGRWVYERKRYLSESGDLALAGACYERKGAGRIRVVAEVEGADGWLPVGPIELRFASHLGFRGALSECFGMPYVFGVGEVMENELSGVETGWGTDCANFLTYAWRRQGLGLVWGDPGRLRRQLALKAGPVRMEDGVSIPAEEIERGIAIDFGKHVAAMWEDREPLGVLGGNDLVAHHLGGFPEVVKLATLAEDRPVFSLWVPRVSGECCRVKLAGDVVLAEQDRRVVDGFGKGETNVFLANLEGVPSMRHPEIPPRYDFRFPKERLAWLREMGVDAVSMANNHAGDAGRHGLLEGIRAVREAGIGLCGAGKDEMEACQPWHIDINGVRVAVFGVSLVDALVADENSPGVAHLPTHEKLMDQQIRRSKADGNQVIVMVHGGDEYRTEVNEEQRRWARWLVARGADVVAGAHPHVVQRSEVHGGATIIHSLGNAVHPTRLSGAASGEVKVVEIGR